MNIEIIYHKNCMDGLASAFIAKSVLENEDNNVKTIPLQYGEEQKFMENEIDKDTYVYFVDFSFKRELMIELASKVKEIIVLDHHKTAEENLKGLEEELDNITIIFDMNKCGATLCFEYFQPSLDKPIFDYIEDRDLWKWQLNQSKEISAYLRLIVKPNDIGSFADAYGNFCEVDYSQFGEILLLQQNIQVASKIRKIKHMQIKGIDFKVLNATENISEIGNAICSQFNTPALMYFITEKDEVVCSLRSTDYLVDVSLIAKAFGGGGHRNACGFTIDIDTFKELIMNTGDKLAELEKVIRDYYIKKYDYPDDSEWGFYLDINTHYKSKLLRVIRWTHIPSNDYLDFVLGSSETTKEMFDKAFLLFQGDNHEQ